MPTDSFAVRDLTSADNDQAFAVRSHSFGKLDPSLRGWWNGVQDELIAQRRLLGVFDGRQLVAVAKGRSFQQFWGGRPVAMCGVAGVVVLPEYRGRGVASLMMRALAERCAELGDAVSALYPATVVPYRRTGWEIVGAQTRISIDAVHLRGLGAPDLLLRPGSEADADRVQALLAQHYASQRANGPMLVAAANLPGVLRDSDAFSYFADDGFVLYEWHEGDLVVNLLVAGSEATARALWSVVGSGSSIAKRVHAYVSPHDPIHLLLPDEASHDVVQQRWMFRLLDAPRAVAARGFGEHLSGSARLVVHDPLLPSNSGGWRLEVESGRGSLTRDDADAGALHLGSNGLAALYAGTPLHTLRVAGLVAGGSTEADAFLDPAFAGPAPYLLEYF